MGRMDRQEFDPMSTEGPRIKARRERLGMTIQQLAREAGVSRDTLSDMESGTKDFRRLTLTKVQRALDEAEAEAGIDAPEVVESADEGQLVEFEVEGNRVIVRGPVANADELAAMVARLIRETRESE